MSHQGKKANSRILPERSNKRVWQLAAISGLLLILAAVLWKTCSGPRDIDLQGYVRSEAATNFVAIVTNRDDRAIIIELYPDIAPITVKNFQQLVGEKFYDGLTFHRIVPETIIQGGDPKGNGSGGPGYTIQGEFAKNGISNTLKHTRGTLSMARTGEPDSAGSQFFICVSSLPKLDGDYAAFGQVLAGMDVVDLIASAPNGGSPDNRPKSRQVMEEVFFVAPSSGDS